MCSLLSLPLLLPSLYVVPLAYVLFPASPAFSRVSVSPLKMSARNSRDVFVELSVQNRTNICDSRHSIGALAHTIEMKSAKCGILLGRARSAASIRALSKDLLFFHFISPSNCHTCDFNRRNTARVTRTYIEARTWEQRLKAICSFYVSMYVPRTHDPLSCGK